MFERFSKWFVELKTQRDEARAALTRAAAADHGHDHPHGDDHGHDHVHEHFDGVVHDHGHGHGDHDHDHEHGTAESGSTGP